MCLTCKNTVKNVNYKLIYIQVIRDGQLKISYSLCESLRLLFFNKLFDTSEQILPSYVFLLKKIYKAADHTPLNYSGYC